MEVKAILPSGNQVDFFYMKGSEAPHHHKGTAVLTYSGKNTVHTRFLGAGLD